MHTKTFRQMTPHERLAYLSGCKIWTDDELATWDAESRIAYKQNMDWECTKTKLFGAVALMLSFVGVALAIIAVTQA